MKKLHIFIWTFSVIYH